MKNQTDEVLPIKTGAKSFWHRQTVGARVGRLTRLDIKGVP